MKTSLLGLLLALAPFSFGAISFCPNLGNSGTPVQVSTLGTLSATNGCDQVNQQYDLLNVVGAATGYTGAPGPSGVTMFGVGTNPGTNNVGIQWSGTVGATNNWNPTDSGNSSDSWSDTITFELKSTDGSVFNGATLLLGNLTNISRTSLTITESICLNSSTFSCGSPVSLSVGAFTTAQSANSIHLAFAPTNDLAVQLVLSATSTANGSRSFTLDNVTTEFDDVAVPEPATWMAAATGIAGLALLRRGRRK